MLLLLMCGSRIKLRRLGRDGIEESSRKCQNPGGTLGERELCRRNFYDPGRWPVDVGR